MESPGRRRQRIDELFAEALEQDPAERHSFLEAACRGEQEILAAVERLLLLTETPSPALDGGPGANRELWRELIAETDSARRPVAPIAGERLGPWRLVRELGRGGMAVVYLAERADGGFEQTAALKLVQPGLDSEEILRRFELERQILASLSHANIARLLDGGRAPDGRPYFVMERVDGLPIDRYSDEHRLTIDQRLELFLQVARAVEHAHRNLVVHRDLKPSNIVVTSAGEVKLLDFGIAKLLASGGEAAEDEPLTRSASRLLTPEYASPEQVRGEPITTASDIYQLGLLLYGLLTGQRAQRADDSSVRALERAVCDTEPIRPSTRITMEDTDHSVFAARRSTPGALGRRLRGDLDNIVLRALRKEPVRRYAAVGQLADDIERYRRGLPIRARPETLGYRTRKFLARHPFGTVAATAFLLLLVIWASTATYQARRIAHERDRARVEARKAERVSEFLTGLFEAADPVTSGERDVTARELLAAGAERIDSELAGEPETQAEMLTVIGSVYRELGLYDEAKPLLERALAIHADLHPDGGPEAAKTFRALALVDQERGDYAAAEELLRQTLAQQRSALGDDAAPVARILSDLAFTLVIGKSDYAEALPLYRQAVAITRRQEPVDRLVLSKYLNNLGIALDLAGDATGAEAALSEALAIKRDLFGEEHPGLATAMRNLGSVRSHAGDLDGAESLYRQVLDINRRAYEGDHPKVAASLTSLGVLLMDSGRYAAAQPYLDEALAMNRRIHGEVHLEVARSLSNLAVLASKRGDAAAAESLYRQSLGVLGQTVSAEHRSMAIALLGLGQLLVERGAPEEAEPLLREALRIRRAKFPAGDVRISRAQVALGSCLAARGRSDEAESLLLEARAALEGSGTPEEREALEALVALYVGSERPREAQRYRAALAALGSA